MKNKQFDLESKIEKLEDILEERLESIENRLEEDLERVKEELNKLKPDSGKTGDNHDWNHPRLHQRHWSAASGICTR